MSKINTTIVDSAQPITEADMMRWMNVVVNAKPPEPVMHPLWIDAAERYARKLKVEMRHWYADRYRQRQQRLKRYGHCGRWDRRFR